MKNMKRKRKLFPAWAMPSDPVKALWWFLHWLLQVIVRFFWIPIILMIAYEVYLSNSVSGIESGITAGVITLFIGLTVWAVLFGLLAVLNISTSISQTLADVNRFQETLNNRRSFFNQSEKPSNARIVEGTITDLDEERRKRRRE